MEDSNYKFNVTQCVVYYTFLNCGGNTATMVNIEMNGQKLLPQFCLPLNKEQKWIMILPPIDDAEESKYTIMFTFEDIVSKEKYKQWETLTIKKDSYGLTLIQREKELLTNPQPQNKPQSLVRKAVETKKGGN